MDAKTIKLLLSDGTLNDITIVEMSKWDGILFSAPRSSYQDLEKEKQTNYWGIYLLVSNEKVYIGQANDLLKRIKEHDKSKNWWSKVLLLTTKDNSLNRSDIDFLEKRFIDISNRLGTLESNNIQKGNSTNISRFREIELNDYVEGALLLMQIIGIKVFNSTQVYNDLVIPTDSSSFEKSTINKSKALKILKDNNIDFKNGVLTFSSLQEKKRIFWANPKIEFLTKNWYLILNNIITREIIILNIPKDTFNVLEDNSQTLITRNDKPYYIDLNLTKISLLDIRTKIDFTPYYIKTVKY